MNKLVFDIVVPRKLVNVYSASHSTHGALGNKIPVVFLCSFDQGVCRYDQVQVPVKSTVVNLYLFLSVMDINLIVYLEKKWVCRYSCYTYSLSLLIVLFLMTHPVLVSILSN